MVTLSWSPVSSSDTVPKVCKFATAGVDGKIRIYTSDLAQTENILVIHIILFNFKGMSSSYKHFVQELSGHGDNVNSIAFQPDIEDKFLVSTSDDFTCKIWSTENGDVENNTPTISWLFFAFFSTQFSTFIFSLQQLHLFAGISVCFNPSEPSKFFVMEKSGVARIFSTPSFSPVTSLSNNYCCQDPALDADWSSSNPTHIVTSLGGRLLHWNLNALR